MIWAGGTFLLAFFYFKIAADESDQLGDVSTLADPAVVDDLVGSRLNKK